MENLEAGVAFVCSQQKFEESDYVKVKKLLDDLPEKCSQRDEIGLERSFERFLYITDLYQEQSHLLDQKLDAMLSVLLGYVKKHWLDEAPPLLIFEAFKYVCHLTKIRGRKVILRHLPHELTDLEPVLKLLERDNVAGSSSFWETRYVLLLWLTLLCKLPFPLSKFDLSSAPMDEHTTPRAPIKQRMLNVATPLLNVMDKSREAAALFLAEFVSRPDTVDEYLTIVIRDTVDSLSRLNPNDVQEGLRAVGLCLLLADIFKRNKRDKLLPVSDYVLNMLIDADTLTTNCQNILLRKLITKLVQRIGLVYLKPQLASWRYQRGSRSLAQNLSVDHKVGQMNGIETNRKMDADESSAYEVREEVERILAFLLHALKDKDTIVRWSAAKGVGRIASRLPKSLASEVIASILTYFNRMESDGAWHGACLALAELGRRGFLLPDQLPAVVPAVVQALTFDESKGNYSVGAHVRDAACYLCWSFARCYEPDQLLPFVGRIASTLITVAIFDREVNCRRAASAAFQENVGRQGVFPHGIDILTVIDYFAVGNRSTCYKDLSIFVGKFPEYTKFLIDHLVDFKINHWDQEIRQLAALSLRQLCSLDANYLKVCILPRLLPQCTGTDDLFLRHGSILAVGEICRGLNDLSVDDIGDVIDRSTILAIPGRLVEMQSLKNVGGELIRSALNRFIENVSISSELIPAITIDHLSVYFDVLNENLCNVTEDIRLEACSSISALSRRASTCANFSCLQYVDKHCRTLAESSTELQRIGAALALGNLADDFLRRCDLPRIIDFLCRSASIAADDKDKHWAECRRDSLDSLRKIVITTRLSVDPVLQEVVG